MGREVGNEDSGTRFVGMRMACAPVLPHSAAYEPACAPVVRARAKVRVRVRAKVEARARARARARVSCCLCCKRAGALYKALV